jgi:pilus assembly protein CpaB
MNLTRIAILAVAAIAAVGAALLVRGLLGGGTPQVLAAPQPLAAAHVLVANADVEAGHALDQSMVRWQDWPKTDVPANYITKEKQADLTKYLDGAFVRAPIVSGEPITDDKVVHSGSASFMAANLTPGMRAISIGITAESGAGGFILPNDRVDVILTRTLDQNNQHLSTSITVLQNVRVLAVDQTYHEDKDQKVVIGKTATLELTQHDAELISMAQAAGTLSLALRGLGDNADDALDKDSKTDFFGRSKNDASGVNVIRYGVTRAAVAAAANKNNGQNNGGNGNGNTPPQGPSSGGVK